jgi:Ser/Thr protein kinase RdoA (MazF antagonist)
MDEEVLTGGNSNDVQRIGRTVHRTPGPWTPAVHALLRALRTAGVREVPEPYGFDEQGREVLSFLPGDVGNYPLPRWLWEPAILADAGALLRQIHDASTALIGQELVWNLPTHQPVEVICHNDVAPYNMTFSNGRVTGLFDFDTASPGPRIWDLAYLAYRLAPLGEDAISAVSTDEERLERGDVLVAAYGIHYSRNTMLLTVATRLEELAVYTDGRFAETGDTSFRDHAAMYRRDATRARTLTSAP